MMRVIAVVILAALAMLAGCCSLCRGQESHGYTDEQIAQMTAASQALLWRETLRVRERFPALSKYAQQNNFKVVIDIDYPAGKDALGIYDHRTKTITLSPTLAMDAALFRHVYLHEVGHGVWFAISNREKEIISREFADELRTGAIGDLLLRLRLPEEYRRNITEVFAELFAWVAEGNVTGHMPKTQKIIRGRIYK